MAITSQHTLDGSEELFEGHLIAAAGGGTALLLDAKPQLGTGENVINQLKNSVFIATLQGQIDDCVVTLFRHGLTVVLIQRGNYLLFSSRVTLPQGPSLSALLI